MSALDPAPPWTLDELERRLAIRLRYTAYRCVFGVLLAPPALHADIEARLHALAATHALPEGTLQIVHFDGSDEALSRVRELNHARQTLLATLRLLVFIAPDAARLRLLGANTPDLTTSNDFYGELVAPPTRRPWDEVRDALRTLALRRHSHLDLTGLVTAHTERHAIPLDDLYLPLVDLPTDEPPPRVLVLIGDAGAGKTTALRHLALRTAQGHDPLRLCAATALHLPLTEYADARSRDRLRPLLDFLIRWLEAQGVVGADTLRDHLGDLVLLLDGFDEVPDDLTRRDALDDLQGLLDQGLAGGVLAGRPLRLEALDHPALQHAPRLALRTPTDAEIERFVHAFAAARQRDDAARDALTRRVLDTPTLRELAHTPLLLAFLCVLDELDGHLPERRVELYHRLSDLLIERWRLARARAAAHHHRHDRTTRGDLLRTLGPLAAFMLERGAPVPEAELRQALTDIERQRDPKAHQTAERAARLLDLLQTDTALLRREEDGRWAFIHTSIAEYLAAIEIERDPARWRKLLTDPLRATSPDLLALLIDHLALIEGRPGPLHALGDALTRACATTPDAHTRAALKALLKLRPALGEAHRRALEAVLDSL